VRELVEAFGPTKSFKLVIDPETGNSKGYGFFVYEDHSVTDVACQGLHGMKMGEKTLTVKRATGEKRDASGGGVSASEVPPPPPPQIFPGTGANLPPPPPSARASATNPPSRVVFLSEMFEIDELRDDGEFADIEEDVRDECGKFGTVVEIAIPRPRPSGEDAEVPGLGRAFVRYETVAAATAARDALHGRKFGGKVVKADFMDVDAFERRAF
jgi:splicing factor U2AF subunit